MKNLKRKVWIILKNTNNKEKYIILTSYVIAVNKLLHKKVAEYDVLSETKDIETLVPIDGVKDFMKMTDRYLSDSEKYFEALGELGQRYFLEDILTLMKVLPILFANIKDKETDKNDEINEIK